MQAKEVKTNRPEIPPTTPIPPNGVLLRWVTGTRLWAAIDTDSMYGPVPPLWTIWQELERPRPHLAWNFTIGPKDGRRLNWHGYVSLAKIYGIIDHYIENWLPAKYLGCTACHPSMSMFRISILKPGQPVPHN